MTFLQLADTELGMDNMERVTRLIGSARTAYEATGKFLTPRVGPGRPRKAGSKTMPARRSDSRCRASDAIAIDGFQTFPLRDESRKPEHVPGSGLLRSFLNQFRT